MPTASSPMTERSGRSATATKPGAIPFLKRFTVFNTDQCENLPGELVTAPPPVPEGLILPQAEALIAATGADFRIGGEPGLLQPRAGLRAGARRLTSLFRADQLAPDGTA